MKATPLTLNDVSLGDAVVVRLASGDVLTGYVRGKLETTTGPKVRVTSTDGNRVVTVSIKDVLL